MSASANAITRAHLARRYLVVATVLSIAGTLFAGYLSSVKLRSGVCAFSEPCPFFLGQPACYTGFLLFLTLLVPTVVALGRRVRASWPMIWNIVVSALGIAFAGQMTLREVTEHSGVPIYGMGLPTCAYGLVFFAAIFGVSLGFWRRLQRLGV